MQFEVCWEAWLLHYCIAQISSTIVQKKKMRRNGCCDHKQSCVQWLIWQADKVGDKLPHGDGIQKSGKQIRMPKALSKQTNCSFSVF